LDNCYFLLCVKILLKHFERSQVLLLGLSLGLPKVALVLLVFEVAIFLIDDIILIDELIDSFLMLLLHLHSKLLYFFFILEVLGFLEVLQFVSKCLQFLLFLFLAFLDQFLHLDLIFWLLSLDLCYLLIVNRLHLLDLSIVQVLLPVVLLLQFLCMFFHLLADNLVFQVLYLILEQVVKLLGVAGRLLLFLFDYFHLLLKLVIDVFLRLL
jgi:hypothetical protein